MNDKYEERLVAFVDILGWSYMSNNSHNSNDAVFDSIINALKIICQKQDMYSNDTKEIARTTVGIVPNPLHQAVECSAFSDSIVLSMPISFGWDICGIGDLCRDLLRLGFLTRGAVTIGQLYHQNGMVFGPALVRAVELEKSAVFPRIVVDKELSKRGEGWLLGETRPVIIDHLGRKVVNLFDAHGFQESSLEWHSRLWRLDEIHERLDQGLRDCADNEHTAEKWRYMQEMVSRMLNLLGDR